MPKPVKQIFVDLTAQPNVRRQKAKSSDAIVWIPESELETITVTFLGGKTPFSTDVLQAPFIGGCVGGVVIGGDDTYKYQISVHGLRSADETTAAADPEIIIDSGSGVPPEPRKSGKSAQKKSSRHKAGRSKKTGKKKKTGRKKAAKKR
jgi:hypothetical protein